MLYEVITSVDLRCEFMDAKHFSAQPYFENFKEYIEKKYAGIRFDLIIAVDNSAFSFLNDYKESLFGDVPVVFCGLNNVYDIRITSYNVCYTKLLRGFF